MMVFLREPLDGEAGGVFVYDGRLIGVPVDLLNVVLALTADRRLVSFNSPSVLINKEEARMSQ